MFFFRVHLAEAAVAAKELIKKNIEREERLENEKEIKKKKE